MATPQQREALLAIACPWCHAAAGEECSVPVGRVSRDVEGGLRKTVRRRISTLDAGCHDARWSAAGLGGAPVLQAVVEEEHAAPRRELVTAGATAGERPW